MFGKKNKKQAEKIVEPDVEIYTIPDVFYGGKDPDIYQPHAIQKIESKNTLTTEIKKKPPRTMVSPKSQQTKTGLFKNKWFVGGVTALILIGGGGITWYYVSDYQQAQEDFARQQAPTQVDLPEVNVVITTPTIVTSTLDIDVSTTPTSTLDSIDVFLEFPPLLTLDTSDIDADNLTDIEEELFNTDSGTWDSDADGYYDGQEVYNLYNPQGFAPVKIIDSGIVREYINPATGYRVYYPTTWQQGSVDVEEKQVLFSSISGDYVEVRIVDKDTMDQSFLSWFGRYAEGQRYTDVSAFTNRFSYQGFTRSDDLVAYFHDAQSVVVMIYHPRDRGPIAYRHVMQMMVQSFRIQNTGVDIPDQESFPGVTSTVSEDITEENITTTTTTTTIDEIEDNIDTLI